MFAGITDGGNDSDVSAKDYAASLRWNFDFNPDHSLYIQGSAQQWDRRQIWKACDAKDSLENGNDMAKVLFLEIAEEGRFIGRLLIASHRSGQRVFLKS